MNQVIRLTTALQSENICGETKRQVTLSGCANERDCERDFLLYIPSSVCDGNNSHTEAIVASNEILPIVFAVHCYGCNSQVMVHWESIAEIYNFVLVIPEGVKSSWNARYCCGYALENNMDDVGFMKRIITDLDNDYNFVSSDVTYAMGWSNGGYMVTYAAHLFRAVAPISGHQYEDLLSVTSNKPIGIFMHHSSNDPFVQITGCCSDSSMPQCCCGISDYADQCTAATTVFEKWASDVNQCNNGTRVSFSNQPTGITCYTGAGDCLANATFCVHRDSKHFNSPSFEKAFPMSSAIADFFAKDACTINDGNWSSLLKECSCKTNNVGTYCLGDTILAKSLTENHVAPVNKDSSIILAIGAVLLGFIFLIMKSKGMNSSWIRVSLTEPRSK